MTNMEQKGSNSEPLSEDKTAHSIALKFTEIFQDNYPKKPAWEMMDDLRKAIEVYTTDGVDKPVNIRKGFHSSGEAKAKLNAIPEPDSQIYTLHDMFEFAKMCGNVSGDGYYKMQFKEWIKTRRKPH